MRVHRVSAELVEIAELDGFCSEMLRQVVPSARADDHPAARARLFSSPTQGRDLSFEEDWKNYVQPELRERFGSAQRVVEEDLSPPAEQAASGTYTRRVPATHLDDWIHCLNQARLVITARQGFTEHDMEQPVPFEGDQRALALFQVHFYGYLQECLLRQLD